MEIIDFVFLKQLFDILGMGGYKMYQPLLDYHSMTVLYLDAPEEQLFLAKATFQLKYTSVSIPRLLSIHSLIQSKKQQTISANTVK